MSKKRIDDLRRRIKAENLDGFIVNNLDEVRYLTGYTGSNGLLVIGSKDAIFLTDFRYTEQAKKQVKGARVTIAERGDLVACLEHYPKLNKKNFKYGYSAQAISVASREQLEISLSDSLMVPADGLVAELGWVKDREEIANIKKAVEISDIAFTRILNIVKPGVREREVAAELEYQMIMLGSEKRAFGSIVASGWRGALPHGEASSKKIKRGEMVTFDFGATVNGYVSDITRTVVVGKATARQKKIYNIVLRAQKAGVRKIRAGVAARDVDRTCRKIITTAGYGKGFGHGTGHGIGFIVHTGPSLAESSDHKLVANNIVTVEPGIYIAGWGGVRIEDDVLVTRNGGQVLNKAEKKLLEL